MRTKMPLSMALASLLMLIRTGCDLTPPAYGCAVAPPPGTYVGIADEEAAIFWEPKTHTETFIRRAGFQTQAPQFGFLVPTPSVPVLDETNSTLFDTLAKTYRPRFIRRPEHGLKLVSILEWVSKASTAGHQATLQTTGAASPPVSVLSSAQVAGYDAVVLRADDAAALTRWLHDHGYDAQPALTAWLQPYVTRHWAVTAFKIAKPDTRQAALNSATVRMSFTTDRPFFPYSEPADQRDGHQETASRLLRVYCLSNARMDGALDSPSVHWPGKVRWAEPLPDASGESILSTAGILSDPTPKSLCLTAFEDRSSPRPGVADLYFTPAAQQTPLIPTVTWPEDRRFPVPIEFIIALVIIGIVMVRRHRAGRTLSTAQMS